MLTGMIQDQHPYLIQKAFFCKMLVVDFGSNEIVKNIACAATIVINESKYDEFRCGDFERVWIRMESLQNTVSFLDKGAHVAVVQLRQLDLELLNSIPSSRLALSVPAGTKPSPELLDLFDYVLSSDMNTLLSLNDSKKKLVFDCKEAASDTKSIMSMLTSTSSIDYIINYDLLEYGIKTFTELFLVGVKSDRIDGLFPTVVVDEQQVALGLCYSSQESILQSLTTMNGVYHSRNRGIWHKGATSGATQALLRVDLDCDSDTFRFTVQQKEPGNNYFIMKVSAT